ncbi:hypothetical protein RB653_005005 [Dictyostelium firmibasis]|uniref:Uncharacterized protein n=1 Tax=Dictyostelium firmibasis TaxID=79012 RepID=A0AAN7U3C7_9MYCE
MVVNNNQENNYNNSKKNENLNNLTTSTTATITNPATTITTTTTTTTQPLFHSNDFYSGLIAGIASRTLTAPLERIKILNQVEVIIKDGVKYNRIIPAFKVIIKEEGIVGLFRGNLVNIIKAGPQSAIRFYSYGAFKRMASNPDGSISLVNRMWAGASSGVVSVAMTHPLDVIKTHISAFNSTNIKEVSKAIYRDSGIFGFFRGLSAGILNIAPFAALNFTFYETIKEKTQQYILHSPPLYAPSIYGAISGGLTMTILYPLDVIKRRIMLQHFERNDLPRYKNFIDAMVKITKTEGISALYKGIRPAYLKVIPTVSINFLIYEGAITLFENKK